MELARMEAGKHAPTHRRKRERAGEREVGKGQHLIFASGLWLAYARV